MNPGKTLLLLQFLLCAATAAAQSAEVRFRVADRATREAVVGAVAELRSRTDTAAAPLYTTSDIDGRGTFPRVPHGDYRLTVTSLGYDSLRRDLRVDVYKRQLLHSTDYLAENEFKSIFTDCRELTNILASILKTMKETK